MVERLLERAVDLEPAERSLLQSVYGDGRTVAELAAIAQANPRTLRRRLRRVIARVLSTRYEFVRRHRETWPATRRRVATSCFIHGRSQREAAIELKLSPYAVRRHYEAVRALSEAAGA